MTYGSPRPVAAAAAVAVMLLSAARCSAQEAMECPSKTAVKSFNVADYMGVWYEYAKYGGMPSEKSAVCVKAKYSEISDKNITVINSMLDGDTHVNHTITGWADFEQPQQVSQEAKLNVHYENATAGMYWVLSTDYHNYSIVWSCMELFGNKTVVETSWILMRTQKPENATLSKVWAELTIHNLPSKNYKETNQSENICGGTGRLVGAALTVLVSLLFINLH